MLLYDLLSYAGGRPPGVPHHRNLTRSQMLRAAPSLRADAFRGGLSYYNAQVDNVLVRCTRMSIEAWNRGDD
ncbi:Glycerol-3-phosphate dehydrogenase [Leifsonia rubra CMS 76R]|nr:Glycerol-3-phosphate dehydrogenase [Leifsonia rubra CMS 76R]